MKNIIKYFIFIFILISLNEAKANSLMNSLKEAYEKNPKINAERSSLNATKESKKEALSDFKPSITISGYVSEQDNTKGVEYSLEPNSQSILVEQKIFQGFGGLANLKKQDKEIAISELKLKKIEQEILLLAVEAHTNLVLSVKQVKINNTNIDLLEQQVETDLARLERGEINLADLAQSEASLSGARAKLIIAQNNLLTSNENFQKIIGTVPDDNIQKIEEINLNLPKNLVETFNISKKENPDLQISILELEKAKDDVIIARSELSPNATLSYELSEQEDVSSTVSERKKQTIKATASWPIYSGGNNIAGLKKAKQLLKQKEFLLEDAKKIVRAEAANAWSNFKSSKGILNSIRSQVKAAEIASEGINQEYELGGDRSTLEVIQAKSILLESRLNLAASERSFLLSKFRLLSAIGKLTINNLKL